MSIILDWYKNPLGYSSTRAVLKYIKSSPSLSFDVHTSLELILLSSFIFHKTLYILEWTSEMRKRKKDVSVGDTGRGYVE